jgi:hypothetical protein
LGQGRKVNCRQLDDPVIGLERIFRIGHNPSMTKHN